MGIRNTSPRNTLQTPIVIGSPTEFDDTFHGDKSSGIPVVLRYTKSNFKKDVKVHIWREPDGQYDDFNHVYPMQHSVSEGDFHTILELPPGIHRYRFEVDGKWVVDPEQPLSEYEDSVVTNILDLSFKSDNDNEALSDSGEEYYSDMDDIGSLLSGSPTELPTHLETALLNCKPIADDLDRLPLPHHVMLNHLYSRPPPQKQEVIVLGLTARYREKYVTTVYYTPNTKEYY
eukprot:TRINITY_DN4167_c0_g1_i2.p1 TRINITY_DN4167_c0_g1~~TRINITY_DN4167_c0_g1_i2.p1  ORF type:complete len:231 (+),score=46.06 TRINITY_DN4167_c0_g1_i2:79-771(+)